MPELPQIQPQGGIATPGVVQSKPNQLGAQIAEFADRIQDQAIEMGKQAQHMNRYINFHAADADYMTQSASIFQATRTIPDPDTQYATRQRVLGQLRDEITKKYPDAGPELGPQLTTRMAEDVKRASLEATATGVQNTKDNLDSLEEPTIVAATSAPTQADFDTIKQGFIDTVHKGVTSGFIGVGEEAKRVAKFQYNLQFALVTKKSLEDPLSVMNMTVEQSGLRPQDLSLIKWRAGGIMERNDTTAKREFQNVINTNDDAIFNGKITDKGQINQLVLDGKASREAGRYGTHAEPTNMAVAGPLLNYINSAPDMTPNEWRHWKANNIDNNKYLEASDREAANGAIAARVSDGETKLGQLKKSYMADIKFALRNKYPGAFGSNANQPAMNNYMRDEEQAVAQLDGAKSFAELKTIHDDLLKNAVTRKVKPISDSDKAKKLMDALGIK